MLIREPKARSSTPGHNLLARAPADRPRRREIDRAGAAITAGVWFLWVRCPACRTTNAIDLRTLDRHRDAAVTSLIPALSCRSCQPNAPFAQLVRLSRTSIVDEMREAYTRRPLG